MNTRTSLIITAASLALLGAANGQTVVDITGSTAGRATVDLAIKNLLTGESTAWYTTDARVVTTSASADGAIYYGGNISGTPVTIRTFWAGSATGVDYVSNLVELNNKFFTTTWNTAGQVTGDTAAVILAGALAPTSSATAPEFGFSDVKQAATIYQTNPLVQEDMFVIPFRYLRTADLTGVDNITNQQVRAHYTGLGDVPKSLYTGIAGQNASVYAVGRDNDSGTRISAFAEAGAGAFATVSQWGFTTTGAQPNLTLSAPTELFDGGYASGGSVGNVLSGTGFNAVGYVGVSDAATAITNGAVALNFNGVPYTVDNVRNGTYTYWSKYQLLRRQSPALTGTVLTVFSSMRTALIALATTGSGSSIKLSDMNVDRQSDGSDVTPK